MDYHYEQYGDLLVDEKLPTEGTLSGREGKFDFKMIHDGIAIYNSSMLGSGFAPATRGLIYVPKTINGIPIVELHQDVDRGDAIELGVEANNLKRLYLKVGDFLHLDDINDGLARFAVQLFRNRGKELNDTDEIDIILWKEDYHIDFCEVKCDRKCRLDLPSAIEVRIEAPTIVIKSVPCYVEKAHFNGRVYPYRYDYYGDIITNNNCFAGNSGLSLIEGTLYGENGWIFYNCKSLKQVHLGNGIKKIPAHAFENCISISDLYVPDTVTEIGEYAFSGCMNLRTIHLPSNIKKIPAGAFLNCSSLTKCYLSDNIETIESKAFIGCTSLVKPWIPRNIKSIAEDAFENSSWANF